MLIAELEKFGISRKAIEVIESEGIKELYPPQEEAIKKGLLSSNKNFLICIPTASGKTLLAELCMVKILEEARIAGERCKVLYIVPLRALASEKYEEFKKWNRLGFRVAISTGDYDSSDSWLEKYDIIISTSEKADSLIRHNSGFIDDVRLLIVDEVHLINDASRGATLEITITRLKQSIENLRILALSATVKNAKQIASWLDAELVKSEWRPVKLREGVYFKNTIIFNDNSIVEVEDKTKRGDKKEIACSLALEAIKNGAQVLIFLSTRSISESMAVEIAKRIRADGVENELSQRILDSLEEPTEICKKLANCIKHGVAFHHAGLTAEQRKIIEQAFRDNKIKILTATPTLAMGVNLPARRVIVRDYTRYDADYGSSEISVLEYKQMAGRAGRPKYDEYGEALLIARNENEKDFLLFNYIFAEPEEIYSKLAMESALRMHALASIAMKTSNDFYSLIDFFSKTFFGFQQSVKSIEEKLSEIISFFIENELIESKNSLFIATKFGKRVSELYIDPLTAVLLRKACEEAGKRETRDISYLHAIVRAQGIRKLYLKSREYEKYEALFYENEKYLLLLGGAMQSFYAFEELLSELKTADFLLAWINEESDESIRQKFSCAPGDIRNRVAEAEWQLYAMQEIAKLFGLKKAYNEAKKLRVRVKHGIREELLELIALPNIGRRRARMLFNAGLRSVKDIREASVEKLARIKGIGEKLAKKIKEAVD